MRYGSRRRAKIPIRSGLCVSSVLSGSTYDGIGFAVLLPPRENDPLWNHCRRACFWLRRLSLWWSMAQLVNAHCPSSSSASADTYPKSISRCGIGFLDTIRRHVRAPRFEFTRAAGTPNLRRNHADSNYWLEAMDDRASADSIQSGAVGSRKSSTDVARGLWADPDGGYGSHSIFCAIFGRNQRRARL